MSCLLNGLQYEYRNFLLHMTWISELFQLWSSLTFVVLKILTCLFFEVLNQLFPHRFGGLEPSSFRRRALNIFSTKYVRFLRLKVFEIANDLNGATPKSRRVDTTSHDILILSFWRQKPLTNHCLSTSSINYKIWCRPSLETAYQRIF